MGSGRPRRPRKLFHTVGGFTPPPHPTVWKGFWRAAQKCLMQNVVLHSARPFWSLLATVKNVKEYIAADQTAHGFTSARHATFAI